MCLSIYSSEKILQMDTVETEPYVQSERKWAIKLSHPAHASHIHGARPDAHLACSAGRNVISQIAV